MTLLLTTCASLCLNNIRLLGFLFFKIALLSWYLGELNRYRKQVVQYIFLLDKCILKISCFFYFSVLPPWCFNCWTWYTSIII